MYHEVLHFIISNLPASIALIIQKHHPFLYTLANIAKGQQITFNIFVIKRLETDNRVASGVKPPTKVKYGKPLVVFFFKIFYVIVVLFNVSNSILNSWLVPNSVVNV